MSEVPENVLPEIIKWGVNIYILPEIIKWGVNIYILPEIIKWGVNIYITRITNSFVPAATMMHSAVSSAHAFVCFQLWCIAASISYWREIPAFFEGSKIRSFVACVHAFASIWITFGYLLMVDERYISLAVILIILSVFIVASFLTIVFPPNPKGHLKRDDNGNNANRKVDGRGGGGGGENIPIELCMAQVAYMFLLDMIHFSNMEMDMTNCLLFLSYCLCELTLMMARLPSEFDVAPASEVVHRAFLVMGLLTAHTMAAELLGEDVVLVCMPQLVAALAWLTIYLGSSDNNAAAGVVDTVDTVVRQAEIPLLCLVGILGSIIIAIYSADEAEGAMDLILLLLWGNMSSAIAAFLSLAILPFLCMLALRQWHHQIWRGQTTVAPSAELEGAIRLLRLCRDNLWSKGIVLVCFAKPIIRLSANKLAVYLYPIFSVFGLILLLAAIMYAQAHGLRGRRARAAVRGEKQD